MVSSEMQLAELEKRLFFGLLKRMDLLVEDVGGLLSASPLWKGSLSAGGTSLKTLGTPAAETAESPRKAAQIRKSFQRPKFWVLGSSAEGSFRGVFQGGFWVRKRPGKHLPLVEVILC